MDGVREWAAALCCACMIGAMISLINPNGSCKRTQGMIISLLTLCVLLRPYKAVMGFAVNLRDYSFRREEYENPELEEALTENAKDVYSSYLRDNLQRILDGAGIAYKNVNVIMDNSENGCISIGQVEVIIKEEDVDNSDRIKELLRPYIGYEPTVRPEQ